MNKVKPVAHNNKGELISQLGFLQSAKIGGIRKGRREGREGEREGRGKEDEHTLRKFLTLSGS